MIIDMKQYLLVLPILILCFEYLWTNYDEEDCMIMNTKKGKYDEEKEKYGNTVTTNNMIRIK